MKLCIQLILYMVPNSTFTSSCTYLQTLNLLIIYFFLDSFGDPLAPFKRNARARQSHDTQQSTLGNIHRHVKMSHSDATHLATQSVSADDLGLHGLCSVELVWIYKDRPMQCSPSKTQLFKLAPWFFFWCLSFSSRNKFYVTNKNIISYE